jgi:hypothetical protein
VVDPIDARRAVRLLLEPYGTFAEEVAVDRPMDLAGELDAGGVRRRPLFLPIPDKLP